MLRVYPRRLPDTRYFTDDRALELDGIRQGAAGRFLRGEGDPHDAGRVDQVLTASARSTIVGYDLVFAAPRSISALMAVDATAAMGVVQAHQHAVGEALRYLEEHAVGVRDRTRGADLVRPARWGDVVAYTHGVNRVAEPHLHDHVVVGSRSREFDRAYDARALYAHAPAAAALYRASMRNGIERRTGWTVVRGFEGREVVVGFDEGYRALWPGRHVERPAKTMWQREEIVERWRDDLKRFEPVHSPDRPNGRIDLLNVHSFGAQLEGRREVARRHVVEAWANAVPGGLSEVEVRRTVDSTYPELGGTGVRESVLSVHRVRELARTRASQLIRSRDEDRFAGTQRTREREGRSR